MTTRRALVAGLLGFIAAPAIVRASSLMPIKSYKTVGIGYDLTYEPAGGWPVRWFLKKPPALAQYAPYMISGRDWEKVDWPKMAAVYGE